MCEVQLNVSFWGGLFGRDGSGLSKVGEGTIRVGLGAVGLGFVQVCFRVYL